MPLEDPTLVTDSCNANIIMTTEKNIYIAYLSLVVSLKQAETEGEEQTTVQFRFRYDYPVTGSWAGLLSMGQPM